MRVAPVLDAHLHVPTWACVVLLLIVVAWALYDVRGTQVVRDQVEQASYNADLARDDVQAVREQLRALAAEIGMDVHDRDVDPDWAEQDTGPMPVVPADTVPMATAWDDSAAELAEEFRPTPFPRTAAGRHRA